MKTFEEINEKNRNNKMNELASKWEFFLEELKCNNSASWN